jgi:hypothetical protein
MRGVAITARIQGLFGRQEQSAEHRGNQAHRSGHEIPSVKRNGLVRPAPARFARQAHKPVVKAQQDRRVLASTHRKPLRR